MLITHENRGRIVDGILAVLPTEETTPFAHWRETVPEYPASYDDRVVSAIKMMFNADGSPRTVRVLNDTGEWWEMEVSFLDPPAWHLLPTEETTGAQPVGRDNDPMGTGGGFPAGTPGNMGSPFVTPAPAAPSYSELVDALRALVEWWDLPPRKRAERDPKAIVRARSLLTRIQGESADG